MRYIVVHKTGAAGLQKHGDMWNEVVFFYVETSGQLTYYATPGILPEIRIDTSMVDHEVICTSGTSYEILWWMCIHEWKTCLSALSVSSPVWTTTVAWPCMPSARVSQARDQHRRSHSQQMTSSTSKLSFSSFFLLFRFVLVLFDSWKCQSMLRSDWAVQMAVCPTVCPAWRKNFNIAIFSDTHRCDQRKTFRGDTSY